jgi:hypothetical protein
LLIGSCQQTGRGHLEPQQSSGRLFLWWANYPRFAVTCHIRTPVEPVRQPRAPKPVRSVTKAGAKTKAAMVGKKAREEELAKERRRPGRVGRQHQHQVRGEGRRGGLRLDVDKLAAKWFRALAGAPQLRNPSLKVRWSCANLRKNKRFVHPYHRDMSSRF